MSRFLRSALMLAVALAPATASAQMVFNSGSPAAGSTPGSGGFGINNGYAADDFSFAATAPITRARFWGYSYFFNSSTGLADFTDGFRGSVAWRIYGSTSGGSFDGSNLLLSGLATPTMVDQGAIAPFGATQRQYDFALGAVLGAGTYWLGLHNGSDAQNGNGTFLWQRTASTVGAPLVSNPGTSGGSFTPTSGFFQAFQLFNDTPVTPPSTTVPEPSTYVLMTGGLAAMAWVRRRRARASA